MHFPPKEVLDDIKAFDALPSTPDKDEIKRQYLEDEIGNFDFYQKARQHLETANKDRSPGL